MPHASEYEKEDRAALDKALLNMRVCPNCRGSLSRVGPMLEKVFACWSCKESWYLPYAEEDDLKA